jgi:membrane protein DedA with SNARE-associated domain
MDSWIARLGYLAVALGTMIEGEAVMIAAGVAAQRGVLELPLVVLSGFTGAFLADQTWFRVGERVGKRVFDKYPAAAAKAAPATRAFERWGALFVLGFRFVYGARTVTPVLLGAGRYPRRRFVALNALGGALWAIVYGYVGFGGGTAFDRVFEQLATP